MKIELLKRICLNMRIHWYNEFRICSPILWIFWQTCILACGLSYVHVNWYWSRNFAYLFLMFWTKFWWNLSVFLKKIRELSKINSEQPSYTWRISCILFKLDLRRHYPVYKAFYVKRIEHMFLGSIIKISLNKIEMLKALFWLFC